MLILLVIFLITIASFLHYWRQRQRDPPGPLGWPIFGSVPHRLYYCMRGKKYSQSKFYMKMREKYGCIWSRRLFGIREIVFTSSDMIYESLIRNSSKFSSRPNLRLFDFFSKGSGIIYIGGHIWKEHRKFTLQCLHNLGVGRSDMEEAILVEYGFLLEEIKKSVGQAVESDNIFSKPVTNIISKLILGQRFDYSDREFMETIESVQMVGQDANIHGVMLILAELRLKFLWNSIDSVKKFTEHFKGLEKWVEKQFNRVLSNYKSNLGEPTCIVEYYLQRQGEIKSENMYSNHEIIRNCVDLFSAGIDTTTHMLSWCTLVLGRYPKIQDRIRRELKEIRPTSLINMDLTKNLNYFKSFLDESFRFFPVIPRIPHGVNKAIDFHGYQLQPNDLIQIDINGINRDPKLWDSPDQFNPDRFLDETKTQYKPNKNLCAFGLGKRSCMGESLARMELHIILTNILYEFEIKLTDTTVRDINSIMAGTEGLIYAPLKHHVVFIPVRE